MNIYKNWRESMVLRQI